MKQIIVLKLLAGAVTTALTATGITDSIAVSSEQRIECVSVNADENIQTAETDADTEIINGETDIVEEDDRIPPVPVRPQSGYLHLRFVC